MRASPILATAFAGLLLGADDPGADGSETFGDGVGHRRILDCP